MLNAAPDPGHAAAASRTAERGLPDLAGFIARLERRHLPPSVPARARLVIADLVGTIVAGMHEPEMRRLATSLCAAGCRGGSTVIGHGLAPADTAALLHGSAGTFLELDEGNRFSRGHPGIHVLPAALAMAQQNRMSGASLVDAFIAGYEVAARIGTACRIRSSMHPHGTWGTVGAAVAVVKLRGGDASDIEGAIGLASTLGLATSVNTMRDGGTVRNAFAGLSGRTALLVDAMLGAGFTGERDGLTSVFDGIAADGFSWERMLDELGHRWEIERNYFKVHACCRFNHATLDALADCLEHTPEPIAPAWIETIDVHTYGLAASLSNAEPVNALSAKYSLPFAVATALVHGDSGVAAFSQQAVDNPAVRRLALKVRVHEDPEMTRQLPQLRAARVELRLASGERYLGSVRTNRGDSEDPLGEHELEEKFMALTAGTWPEAHSRLLWRRLLSLDSIPDVSTLFEGSKP